MSIFVVGISLLAACHLAIILYEQLAKRPQQLRRK